MYVDLHSHFLPAVDDGSPDMATSLEWLTRVSDGGVEAVAVTPHVSAFYFGQGGGSNPSEFIPQAFDDLLEAAADLPVKLYRSGELSAHSTMEQTHHELEIIALGPADNKWLLLEAALFADFDKSWSRAADHLRNFGYNILMAHPERAPNMAAPDARRRLASELDKGVRLQINMSSLNSNRAQVRRLAREFVSSGIGYCIASDIHPPTRPNLLFELPEHLERAGLDPDLAPLLAGQRPARLLEQGF